MSSSAILPAADEADERRDVAKKIEKTILAFWPPAANFRLCAVHLATILTVPLSIIQPGGLLSPDQSGFHIHDRLIKIPPLIKHFMQRSLLSHYQPDTGEPHAAAQYQCVERDGGVCVLTGTSNPKPYSIVPFAWVQSMAVIKKSTVVLPVPSTLFDEPRRLNAVWNMLSLDPRLHNYWCRGCFAFKFITAWPIMNGAGESIVMLEFHWMPQFKTKPMAPVVLEGQINDLETLVYEVEAFDKVEVPVSHLEAGSSLTSGRRLRLRMKTEDSVLFREMIELQWVCIVIASLCGATGSLDLLPDFEGFEDTSAAERLFAWIQDQAKWTKERMESAELDEEMLDAMRKLEGQ